MSRRYPEYQDSEDEMIGALPADWDSKQVRRLLKDGRDGIRIGPFGSALKLEDLAEDGICVYGQENVIGRSFSLGKRYITEERFLELEAYEAKAGDLLITMMGTSGKCTIIPAGARKGIIDSHLLRLRVRPKIILPEYFRLLIDECHEIAAQIEITGKGSIMHGLNSAIVKSLVLPLPTVEEQGSILVFLNFETAKIDALIEKQRQLIALLKEKRQAVISHAVTKGLNPDVPMHDSGVEWLGEVPAHWEVVRLKHTCQIQSGMPKGKPPSDMTVDMPMLRVANVQDGWLNLDDVHRVPVARSQVARYLLRDGDVLMNEGGDRDKLGRGSIWRGEVPDCIHQNHVFAIRPDKIEPEWLDVVTRADYAKFHFYRVAKQSTNLASISSSNIKETPLVIPPNEERRAILVHLRRMLAKTSSTMELAEQQNALLQERRTALISAAVTGKIDVRGWNAPESATEAEVT